MTAALGPVGVPFQPDNLSLPGWLNIRHLERKEGPLLSQSIPVSPEPGELFVVRRCCQHCSNSMTLRLWAGGYLRVSTRAVWGKAVETSKLECQGIKARATGCAGNRDAGCTPGSNSAFTGGSVDPTRNWIPTPGLRHAAPQCSSYECKGNMLRK